MSWNADQLRWLRALGHEPMLLRPAGAEPGREEPARGEEPRPTGAASGALAAALARAAGGRDLSALALDLDALRRDPASKRALWPKLRGLRRGH
jgi:hypothetical protein